MDFTHFTAGKDDSDRRLDRILRRFLSEENLSSLYKSLRKGLIKVNGKKCDGNFRIKEGDTIAIADFLLGKTCPKEAGGKSDDVKAESFEPSYLKENKFIESITIFKNEALLILNKPYDIPVQPSSSSKGTSLAEIVQKDYELSHKNTSLSFRTGPLHRLDRKTTGLIAFSQNLEGAKWFSEKIKSHEIQKVYLALLEGKLTEKTVWEDDLHNATAARQGAFHTVSVSADGEGKNAYTEVTPLSHGIFNKKSVTLARILIKTGRTHQIRAQAAFHGFPLLGDTAYGGQKIDVKRIGQEFFLHAAELHFPKDNSLGLAESITAPIPQTFEKILQELTLKKVL